MSKTKFTRKNNNRMKAKIEINSTSAKASKLVTKQLLAQAVPKLLPKVALSCLKLLPNSV